MREIPKRVTRKWLEDESEIAEAIGSAFAARGLHAAAHAWYELSGSYHIEAVVLEAARRPEPAAACRHCGGTGSLGTPPQLGVPCLHCCGTGKRILQDSTNHGPRTH